MEKGAEACFCSSGVMVFRQVLNFRDEGGSEGYRRFRSRNFPESWDHQWFIEVNGTSPSHFTVNQDEYGKSPKATFVFIFGRQAPVTLEWPSKRTSSMTVKFPLSNTLKLFCSNAYLLDYAITMNATLKVPLEGEYAHLARNQCFEFHNQLKAMFENQLGSDVTIIASNGQIPAHWAMIAARSPFFLAMTKSECKERQENKIVVDISYETCKKMMQFIYSNQTEITQEEEGRELLKAADMYLVDGLKAAAGNFLCSVVTPSSAVELLILSHLYNSKALKMKAMDVLLESSKSVNQHEKFHDLCKYPDLVAELVAHSSSKKA